MERQIKFMAWIKSQNRIIKVFGFNEHLVFEQTWDSPSIKENIFEIEDTILMQFTGLKDKNGVDIYEGDIIKSESHEPSNYLVEFIEGGYCATHPKLKSYPIDINHFYPSIGTDLEVIGNIYENPNLLQDGK